MNYFFCSQLKKSLPIIGGCWMFAAACGKVQYNGNHIIYNISYIIYNIYCIVINHSRITQTIIVTKMVQGPYTTLLVTTL